MSDQLQIPPGLLDTVRSDLDKAASGLEDTAGGAPTGIDAGDMQGIVTAMMSRVVDNAATISEVMTAISSQVGNAGVAFWQTDDAVASTYRGKE
jgi:hypothetical protein